MLSHLRVNFQVARCGPNAWRDHKLAPVTLEQRRTQNILPPSRKAAQHEHGRQNEGDPEDDSLSAYSDPQVEEQDAYAVGRVIENGRQEQQVEEDEERALDGQ